MGFGRRSLRLPVLGEHAHLRHLQRLQLHLDGRHLLAEALVLDQRLVAGHHLGGQLLDALHALLGVADAGDARALVAEQELGAVPAAVLLADQVLDRHLDLVEEHLVHLMPAVHGLDRAHGDAGRLHVDQQERDAELLLGRGVRAAEAEDPVGVLRQRGPGLLAVDDVVVALAHRRGLEAGEVGAGAGLGEALAPPVVQRRHARQEALLLLLGAEGDHHRAAHRHVEGQRLRHAVVLQLLGVDVVLHRRPIRAAPFLGPMRHGEALGVQDLVRLHHLLLGEVPVLAHLLADALRHGRAEERAQLLAEGVLFVG